MPSDHSHDVTYANSQPTDQRQLFFDTITEQSVHCACRNNIRKIQNGTKHILFVYKTSKSIGNNDSRVLDI